MLGRKSLYTRLFLNRGPIEVDYHLALMDVNVNSTVAHLSARGFTQHAMFAVRFALFGQEWSGSICMESLASPDSVVTRVRRVRGLSQHLE